MVWKTPKKGGCCGGWKGEEKLEMERFGRWVEEGDCEGNPRLEMVTFWAGNMELLPGKRQLPKWNRNRNWHLELVDSSQPGNQGGGTVDGEQKHRE